MTENELEAALLDVRKAYRLLYGFHRRIFDMARVVDGALNGYEFQQMSPGNDVVSAKWKPQKKTTDYWKALPFYNTDFIWAKTATGGQLVPGDRIFGFSVFADDDWGGEEGEQKDYELAPEEFGSAPEESKTTLYLSLANPVKALAAMTIEAAWEEFGGVSDMTLSPSDKRNFAYVQDKVNLASVPTKAALVDLVATFLKRAETLLSG